jgi:hypothetical protein
VIVRPIDEAYELPFAARGMVQQFICMLTSGALMPLEPEADLDKIIRAKRPRALATA